MGKGLKIQIQLLAEGDVFSPLSESLVLNLQNGDKNVYVTGPGKDS